MFRKKSANQKELERCHEQILKNFPGTIGEKLLTSTLISVTDKDFKAAKDGISKVFPNQIEANQETFKCLDLLRDFNKALEESRRRNQGLAK